MKALFLALILANTSLFAQDRLEQGVALTDIKALKILEAKGFTLASLLTKSPSAGLMGNSDLARTNAFAPVVASLNNEMNLFKKSHPDTGVGMKYGKRLFDINYLSEGSARFVLVGVINRMDQAYKSPGTCGEIRFIYRLAYKVKAEGDDVSSRLPMTVNLVFNSTGDCASLAKAWRDVDLDTDENAIAASMISGPLTKEFFSLNSLLKLEVNLQIVRWPAAIGRDFGGYAEYLLKVYKWQNGGFVEGTMENQIDRRLLETNPALMKEFKAWIMLEENMKALDQGIHLIPEKFLAKTAFSIAPGGINRSGNRPFYGLFSPAELAAVPYAKLEIIKSQVGFLRRLNDSTCVGCHQTRGIGGFHFTGADPQGKYPGNSVMIPGSAHFFGDLNRRKLIQEQYINGFKVDYSRGFSARPKAKHALGLENKGLYNGWGAHCAEGSDTSFSGWSCAAGLECRALLDKSDDSGQGICLPIKGQQIGDPCEMGKISTSAFGVDKYTRVSLIVQSKDPAILCSPQSAQAGSSTGGFLNGSIRKRDCSNLSPEAVCGPLPAAKAGFNACVGSHHFAKCIAEFATGVGLRGCDASNPCRDDYICSESFETKRGACVPPYFLFQFRVDGHPLSKR